MPKSHALRLKPVVWHDPPDMAHLSHFDHFVQAQDPILAQVRRELKAGCKRSHWMWFVFPQLTGLGSSFNARRYAIESLSEARVYLEHPILGARLIECTTLVNNIQNKSVREIFGNPDNLKFHSSMTLFSQAQPNERAFLDAIEKYFDGLGDQLTIAGLAAR